MALDNMLSAYYEGTQIALHRISCQRNYGAPAKAPFYFVLHHCTVININGST